MSNGPASIASRQLMPTAVMGGLTLCCLIMLLRSDRDHDWAASTGREQREAPLRLAPGESPASTAEQPTPSTPAPAACPQLERYRCPLRQDVGTRKQVTKTGYSKGSKGINVYKKYSKYAQSLCNDPDRRDLSRAHYLAHHLRIVRVSARLLQLKPGDVVLDWGSGCGLKLREYQKQFGACGLGVELTDAAVQAAVGDSERRQNMTKYCAMNGKAVGPALLFGRTAADGVTALPPLPGEGFLFDHVSTYGATMHLDSVDNCDVYHRLLALLKEGGRLFDGFKSAAEPCTMTEDEVRSCVRGYCENPHAAVVELVMDEDALLWNVSGGLKGTIAGVPTVFGRPEGPARFVTLIRKVHHCNPRTERSRVPYGASPECRAHKAHN